MKHAYAKSILILTLAFLCGTFTLTKAAVGDTTIVAGLDTVHMKWNESYSRWVTFPDGSLSYGKILMKYRLRCPSSGCSDWDYTTQVFADVKTGTYDSTLIQYPLFTVANNQVDSIAFNTSLTYTYIFNSTTMATDSIPNNSFLISEYGDVAHPTIATNSFLAYPGDYYNHIYNSSGVIVDSVFVGHTAIWYLTFHNVYIPHEILEPFELTRVMTPYAHGFSTTTWKRDYWFDVTDYAPLLKDSVQMRIYYDGWSDGFLADISFYFIEGTPPRNVKRVRNVYPNGQYNYGIPSDPIENHFPAVSMDLNANEKMGLVRIIPSGHSFGDNQDCAEFCPKNYQLFLDNTQRFNQLIWRDDCGMNPLLHQPGTWLFDRANWCPGLPALRHDHEITPFITSGNPVLVNLNFDPYTSVNLPSGSPNPNYYVDTQLFTYDSVNFSLNASLEEIIAPNNEFEYARFNPICNNPIVKIKK